MDYPVGFKFTKDHEWIAVSGNRGRVGVTDYAQKQLGDVVYLELPEIGARLKQGQSFGAIESVKAVSEIVAPLSGEVVAVNDAVVSTPELVNDDPYGAGWLVKVKLSNAGERDALLDAQTYQGSLG